MNQSDAARFRELVQGVYSFYRREVSDFQLNVWWHALKQLDYEAVKDAFNRHLLNPDNGQFEPKPADIVKLIGGGTQDRALVAWSKFELAVQFVGSWDTVVFDDPIIHAVAQDMGGWVELCGKPEKEWPFLRNEFVQRYRAYAMRPLVSYPAKLIGQTEGYNATRFPEHVQTPRFVGDEATARKVLLNGAESSKRLAKIGELVNAQQPSRLLAEKSMRHQPETD